MAKLEEMIEERRRMVADHESGHRKLSDDEYMRANKQFGNFQRKLEQMRNRNTDVSTMASRGSDCWKDWFSRANVYSLLQQEHHRERLEELESLNNMNRLDYLDVKEDLRGLN